MTSAGNACLLFGVAWIISSVSTEEVDLMDTRRATTDLNWFTSPKNGWNELSSQDETEATYRTFQVCKLPNQRNWLLTNYIKFDEGVTNIYVEIKFSIRSCQDPLQTSLCKETFNLHYFESNDTAYGRTHFDAKLYEKIDTIAADQTIRSKSNHVSVVTRRVGYLTSKGMRIGIEDSGSCMMIYYVRVYYKRCASTVRSLANFSTTATGPSSVSLVKSKGRCVNNAIRERQSSGPNLHCNAKGEWQLPEGACQCLPGHEPNEDMTGCVICGMYRYKSVIGNRKCSKCPSYSSAPAKGSVECGCDSGYFRAAEDESSAPCTRPPSEPQAVQYRVKDTTVHLEWSRPAYSGGRNDIRYRISCSRCDSTYTLCSDCDGDVMYVPDGPTLLQPQVSVMGLWRHTHYCFKVYSYNGVSELSGKKALYADAKIKTNESVPSAVRMVKAISSTDSNIFLTWKAPADFEGVIRKYEAHISSGMDRVTAVSRSYSTASLSLLIEDLPPNETFTVKVRAQNEAGFGPFSSPVSVATLSMKSSTFNPKNIQNSRLLEVQNTVSSPKNEVTKPDYSLTAVIISLLCVIIIASGCAVVVIRIRKRREKFGCEDIEVYPFFDNPGDLLHQHKEQRSYVDPRSCANLSHAALEFTREIDCYKVKQDKPIVTGKFSDTCKGFLRPTSFICDDTISTSMSLKPSNLSVAIKVLKDDCDDAEKVDFLQEAFVMGQFYHPNVLRLEGVVTRNKPIMIVTEWMENGPLDKYLENHGSTDIIRLCHMLHDVAEGMRYLSQMGFTHRDLSARNILVTEQLVCKISDFRLNKTLENIEEDGATIQENGMPIRWAAPEVVSQQNFTSASDVWSFGIVAWEVLKLGERPYWDMSNQDIIYFIDCGYRLPPPPFCPRILHSLMVNCWNSEQSRRPTFNQVASQLESVIITPETLHDTINNIPLPEQPEYVPELLDISSLCQWLEDMDMSHYRDIILRHGCVTADQIISLSANQLDEMGITDPSMQRILLDGAEFLRQKLQHVNVIGIGITV